MKSYLNIKPQNIIVIGDVMLDIMIDGAITKIANESPIPVLHQNNEIKKLGGCGNVLMNLQSLGCSKLFLVSMLGDDTYGKVVQEILSEKTEIISKLYIDSKYCTTVKTRGISNKKIIFRYDIEKRYTPFESHIEDCKKYIDTIIKENQIDAIILSDYNKGFLVKELTSYVISVANRHGVPTFVDPKIDYKKYIGCTVFKPNIKEIKDIFDIDYCYENLKEIHEAISLKVECKDTLITLSEKGITLLSSDGKMYHEQAVSTEVCDVTGAGDIVISIIAYYYKHIDKHTLLKLSTWIGTHSVKFTGTYTVKSSDIIEAYKSIHHSKLVSIAEISNLSSPIVITNGCFDIIHEGHIALFKFCKSIAGTSRSVVVALNGDESIKSLKGETRPINNLESRIIMLNEIECIDWIVVFNENTPYELYSKIKPDILVKGGDYKPEELVGREFCNEVRIFNYIEGKSTSNIISKINKKYESLL
jgi:D-beta-D-heptose 7-phosphate kinase/D-beta-D-heptose 1-phosphate adenosyltransferase